MERVPRIGNSSIPPDEPLVKLCLENVWAGELCPAHGGLSMLTDLEYLRFANVDAGLSSTAKQYIQMVRSSEPSRMVGTHARSNVVSFLPSRKMGRSISTESRGPERAFVVLAEYEERIAEFWDQPEPIKVIRTDKRGRRRAGSYTPDFLVLGQGGAELVEVKTLSEVERLAKRYPDDWILDSAGAVRYVPGETAAQSLGLKFRVWVYTSSMRFLVSNIELILHARSVPDVCEELKDRVVKAMAVKFAWTLEELAEFLALSDYTAIIQAVDQSLIYTDLRTQLLSRPQGCVLASSETLFVQATEALDQLKVSTLNLPETQRMSKIPSQEAADAAIEKLKSIGRGDSGRSVRRWRAQISEGNTKGLSAFQSLLPKYFQSGNSRRKINRVVAATLDAYLREEHGHLQGISDYRSYVRYRVAAKEAHPGFDPVHRSTFARWLNRIPPELIGRQRGGKRAGNAAKDASDTQERQLRAQLPWQLVSIDHYLADVFLVYFSSDQSVLVERPWVTAMIDQATGSLLAFTCSFMSPSRHAVSKIFRECVRMHGRLPQEVILDHGSEFTSVYMASLLAHYEVGYSLRPASDPRYGAEVERFFGAFKQEWLSQRKGNLADYKEARAVDGKLSPRKKAVMRPADFIRELSAYRNWRENKMRGTHIESSGYAFKTLTEGYPFIGCPVQYDSEFLMMTAVETVNYKIDQRRGISASGRWYYAAELRHLRGKKKNTDVRIDPENPYTIYASVEGAWVPCFSSDANTYAALDGPSQKALGMTQLEMSAARGQFKQEQDEDLVKLLREMDLVAEQSQDCPVAYAEDKEGDAGDAEFPWLDRLELDRLPPLEPVQWEVR